MPRIEPLRRARWASSSSTWPGPLTDDAFDRLNALVDVPGADAVLPLLDDPAEHARAQAILAILHRGGQLRELDGPRLTLDPDVPVVIADAGAEPVPGPVRDALDRVFAGDGWALRVRAPLPDDIDLEPIRQALRLWLTARTMARHTPTTVVYDHEDISLEFTSLAPLGGGLRATVGPLRRPPVDVLDEALRACPGAVVVAVRSGQRFGRHALQSRLYGSAELIDATSDGAYGATVLAEGWLARHPRIAEVWWIEPEPAPFGAVRRLVSPWGPSVGLDLACEHTCRGAVIDSERATLRWIRAPGESR